MACRLGATPKALPLPPSLPGRQATTCTIACLASPPSYHKFCIALPFTCHHHLLHGIGRIRLGHYVCLNPSGQDSLNTGLVGGVVCCFHCVYSFVLPPPPHLSSTSHHFPPHKNSGSLRFLSAGQGRQRREERKIPQELQLPACLTTCPCCVPCHYHLPHQHACALFLPSLLLPPPYPHPHPLLLLPWAVLFGLCPATTAQPLGTSLPVPHFLYHVYLLQRARSALFGLLCLALRFAFACLFHSLLLHMGQIRATNGWKDKTGASTQACCVACHATLSLY